MKRYDLSDFEWSVIEPLLPNKPRGVPRVDDRRVLNGIMWVLRSGGAWRDLPERYGPYTTCYNRFNRWRKKGIWDRLMDAIVEAYDGNIQMIDSSSVRVHQHAAGSKKGGPDRCMGRSRGGLTTKIHAVVDASGLPLRFALSPGQAHDSTVCHGSNAVDVWRGSYPSGKLLANKFSQIAGGALRVFDDAGAT